MPPQQPDLLFVGCSPALTVPGVSVLPPGSDLGNFLAVSMKIEHDGARKNLVGNILKEKLDGLHTYSQKHVIDIHCSFS